MNPAKPPIPSDLNLTNKEFPVLQRTKLPKFPVNLSI